MLTITGYYFLETQSDYFGFLYDSFIGVQICRNQKKYIEFLEQSIFNAIWNYYQLAE